MSSKILGNDQPSEAAPMLWRMVSARWRRRADSQRKPSAKRRGNWIKRGAKLTPKAWRPDASKPKSSFGPPWKGSAETLDTLARLRETIREETIQDLVHLATSIAARVIHREVAVDPDALAGLIQAAFSKLQSREINRVRMHPTLEAAGSQAAGAEPARRRIWR